MGDAELHAEREKSSMLAQRLEVEELRSAEVEARLSRAELEATTAESSAALNRAEKRALVFWGNMKRAESAQAEAAEQAAEALAVTAEHAAAARAGEQEAVAAAKQAAKTAASFALALPRLAPQMYDLACAFLLNACSIAGV